MRIFLAGLLLALLVGCVDQSQVGTLIDKDYNIRLVVQENTEVVEISIPITVDADQVSDSNQESSDKVDQEATIPLVP